jgi:hypothetical protein
MRLTVIKGRVLSLGNEMIAIRCDVFDGILESLSIPQVLQHIGGTFRWQINKDFKKCLAEQLSFEEQLNLLVCEL